MSTITSTGMGSGLDINAIVKSIVGAEKDPALAKMNKAEGQATAIISAYGLLNSELSSFKSSYKDLGRSSTFAAAAATSSDSSVLDTKLGIGAATGQWEFEVKQRAQAQTLVSSEANGFSATTDTIGEGTLVLSFGSYNYADADADKVVGFNIDANKPTEKIIIDATNNSLAGMRDTINKPENGYSVSASIINDGENYRLVLTNKETGEQNAVQMVAQDKDGVPITGGTGLDRFNYSASEQKMKQTSKAQDAHIVMNGISIKRDSNEVSSVIEGVTLNLNDITADGKKVTLTIKQDTSKVEEQVRAFVENYNNTIAKMNELTIYNGPALKNGRPTGIVNGALNGDSTVRNIQSSMRGALNTIVENIDGTVHSFADIGILTNRDGTLGFDGKDSDGKLIFPDILKKDMTGVANFFTASGAASDPFISFEKNSSLTKPGTYGVEVTQLATQGNFTGLDISGNFPLTIDDKNDTFKMRVDGFETEGTKSKPGITLSQGSYDSIGDLATELQSKINSDPNFVKNGISVRVIEDAGKLSFTSNKYGSESTVAFTGVDTSFLATLGIEKRAGTPGVNVEGVIDGKKAFGDGQFLLSENGDSTGLKLLIEGGLLGERGNVTYAEGLNTVMNDMLTGIIDSNISGSDGDVGFSKGIIDGKIDSLYKKNAGIAKQRETLALRMDKMEIRLFKQFNAMDMAVANMTNTKNYLASTLDALPGYTRNK